MSKKNTPKTIDETVSRGSVTNCLFLNVRAKPSIKADVLCTIAKSEEITIDLDNSKGSFYKVRTASGVDGYCMKKYIALVSR